MAVQPTQKATKENADPAAAGGPRGQRAEGDKTARVSEVTGGLLGFHGTLSPPQILTAG